jgi:anti-sigma factor RsiW
MTGAESCEGSVDLFGEYVDGVLAPEPRERFEAHLASCLGCSRILDEYRRIAGLARRATDVALPAAAGARLRRLLARTWRRHG